MNQKAKIDTYHVQLLSYFLEKMRSTPDGDGSLLDHSLILYGSGLGDGNLHRHSDLPCLLAGKLNGKFETGYHLDYKENTPMANLLVTLLDKTGVEACFLYCGHMVAAISYLNEPKAAAAVMHAYNRWMLDDWGFNYKDRIYSAPLVTLDDIDAACAEAEWAIKNGTRLFLMPMGPFGGKPPAHPDFDRFWSLLNEAHCRVVYHVSEAIYMKDHMAVWGGSELLLGTNPLAKARVRNKYALRNWKRAQRAKQR
jgi:hypothetical protein